MFLRVSFMQTMTAFMPHMRVSSSYFFWGLRTSSTFAVSMCISVCRIRCLWFPLRAPACLRGISFLFIDRIHCFVSLVVCDFYASIISLIREVFKVVLSSCAAYCFCAPVICCCPPLVCVVRRSFPAPPFVICVPI